MKIKLTRETEGHDRIIYSKKYVPLFEVIKALKGQDHDIDYLDNGVFLHLMNKSYHLYGYKLLPCIPSDIAENILQDISMTRKRHGKPE